MTETANMDGIEKFGRYEDLRFLGQGGMARVYRAFDPLLGRHVALKFIRGEDPELASRLMAEARVQAKLHHRHICQVYEVGAVDGKPYIAMQYIDGRSLSDLRDELTLEEKVRLMQEVAEAAHVAHRAGLIHRDLKPANILVEKNEERWVPYVLDFGLARDVTGSALEKFQTATGVIVGSPWYMSPEQARGETRLLDRRCDVYSLGVTLYELLSGRLPFEGKTAMEILLQVLNGEPLPLNRVMPGISPDLSTIVMKCLEKEPAQRYDSARSLSEDLTRFLDGDPILARPTRLTFRLIRKIRKNRTAAVIVSALLLLAFVLGGTLIWVQWRARMQARYAADFMQDVRYVESLLRGVSMAPLHDVRPEEMQARNRLRQVAERMNEAGASAYGPGNDALGEGYLILKDYDLARQYLDKAWNSGYHQPSTAYALGQVLGFEYQRQLGTLDRYTNKEMRDAHRKEITAEFRDRAVEYLKRARGSVESPDYVEGLIALYEERYPEALQKAAAANSSAGWLYDAKKLEGDVHLAVGRKQSEEGKYEEAKKALERSGDAFALAKDLGRSAYQVYVGDCQRLVAVMQIDSRLGNSPEHAFREAVRVCDQAIRINPDRSEAYVARSNAALALGVYHLYTTGEDPRPYFRDSIALAAEAGKRSLLESEPFTISCAAFQRLGEYQIKHGEDPRPAFANAQAQCSRALSRVPTDVPTINAIGAVFIVEADYETENGMDPRTTLQNAAEQYKKAQRINPSFSAPYSNLGSVYYRMALYEMNIGGDPEPYFRESLQQFKRALQLNPKYANACINMGNAFVKWGDFHMDQGSNPEAEYREGADAYSRAMQINPSDFSAYSNKAAAKARYAIYLHRAGRNPEEVLKSSIADAKKSLDLNSEYDSALLNLGESYRQLALLHISDPTSESMLEQARSALHKALSIDLNYDTYQALGSIEIASARWSLQRKRSPEAALDRGKAALQASLKMNSREPETFRILAEEELLRAGWIQSRGLPAEASLRAGLKASEDCLTLMRFYPQAMAVKGSLLLLRAKEVTDPGVAVQARESLQESLRRNPLLRTEYDSYYREAGLIQQK